MIRKFILCAALALALAATACNSTTPATVTPSMEALPTHTAEPLDSGTPTVRVVITMEATVPAATPTLTAEPLRATPTSDPLRHIPERGMITTTYTVRRGDTLSGIATAIDASIEELQQMNELPNADRLQIGQVLQIHLPIVGHAPAIKLIPDSELVYSSSASSFSVADFMSHHSGYLKTYTETVDNMDLTGPQIVQRVAEQFSINPRILLALLEYKSGWVDDPAPTEDALKYPLGYNRTDITSLNLQLNWAAARLDEGYYGWRLGTRLWVKLNDNTRSYMGDGINAGTAGLQNYLSAISTRPVWLNVLGNGPGSFIPTYRRLFGDPWKYDLGQLVPHDLQQPALTLPWTKGLTWLLTGGPHSTWGVGSPWGALDFTSWYAYGCNQLSDWVTAMAPGVVVRSIDGEVGESLDPSGDEHIGWSVLYMHIAADGRVKVGSRLKVGDRIGHPSCEGGVVTGSHVHVARKYNGEWLTAGGSVPFVLSGWTAVEGSEEYDGKLTNGRQVRTPCECKELNTNAMTW